jgi:RNA polymerase sigma-70 factor (ECF subfamily)
LTEPEPRTENWSTLSDAEVVARVCGGESGLFELLMRRYNQRVYRVGRAVLRDDLEAEELAQETWVRVYTHLSGFEGRSTFATWLTRIAYNEAWALARRRRRFESLDRGMDLPDRPVEPTGTGDPEQVARGRELRSVVEGAVITLPLPYRTVFVLRQIEELSTEETAEILELTPGAVKVRLYRARALLRRKLSRGRACPAKELFPFLGSRCDRIVRSVGDRIRSGSLPA